MSQRQRTTWTETGDGTSREAATSRTADPYNMNQEHPQPSPVDYENGDPDAWAETPTDNQLVYDGYDGAGGLEGREQRNDLNFAEFKPETFNHKDEKEWKGPGKYDNAKVSAAVRKAGAAERVARAVLRTSNEKLVEAQAEDLMALPDQVLIATLKRLDSVSPDALPKDRKYNRAMACCKFAADVLGEAGDQETVERLGRTLMSIDDPTLKEVFQIVAKARAKVAGDDEGEDDAETAAAPPAPAPAPAPTAGGKMDEDEDDAETAGGAPEVEITFDDNGEDNGETAGLDAGCLAPEDMAMLDSMLEQEGAPPAAPMAAPPAGELTDLFEAAPAAPAAPMAPAAPVMPATASDGPDITFGEAEDGEQAARTASSASDSDQLDVLFNDHPEVQAQREIAAAQAEQRAREGGYGPVSDVRTASEGAKKLGNVRGGKAPSMDQELESIWDRPQA